MRQKEKIHRVSVNSAQPISIPRHGTLALRKSRLMKRRMRQAFYVAGFTLSMGAICHAGYGFLMGAPYLTVKSAKVEGISGPLAQEVQGLVSSLMREKRNILEIDAEELTQKIGRHPRIRDLTVEKIYPDQLIIHAVERQEVAVLATDSEFFLADNEGNAMERLSSRDLAQLDLPYISGLNPDNVHEGEPVNSESLIKAINLLQVLNERNPELYKKVSDVQIQSDEVSPLETLTMHLVGGLDVRFGDGNPIDRLPHFDTMVRKLEQDGMDPYSQLAYIDLRFKNMAFYMDKDTARDIDAHRFESVQEQLDEVEAEYQKKHPVTSKFGDTSADEDSDDADDEPARPAKRQQQSGSESRAARPTRPSGNNTNYPQSQQQSSPAQYYQQRRQNPPAPSTPMYNLPANQPRY